MSEEPPLESSIATNETVEPGATCDACDVDRLFREHNAALLRFISAKLGSDQDAKEIAQEAYVHLLQLNHPETISYLRAFLFKTASNLAIDRLRQRGRRTHVTSMPELDFAVFDLSPERQISGQQDLAAIGAAVAELPAKCRQAFLLHRVHSVPIDDIAARMGIGACMVRRYVARGLDYIRHRLDTETGITADTVSGRVSGTVNNTDSSRTSS